MHQRTNLPVIQPEREPLTEGEARAIGDSCYRLGKLRRMLELPGGCELFVGLGNERIGHRMSTLDGEALLSLLIERERAFLASFNVETTI